MIVKKYIIFGAGHDGKELLAHLGKDKVAYFCDNNEDKVGMRIDGIKVIPFDEMIKLQEKYTIFIAVGFKQFIIRQFQKAGIKNYLLYESDGAKNDRVRNDEPMRIMDKNNEMNALLNYYLSLCSASMPIENFEEFRDIVKECKSKLSGEYAFHQSFYNESILYGHARALMEYAGILPIDYANFPLVRHGPFDAGTYPEMRTATIYWGEYEKEIYNTRYAYIPFFTVGPYIQYAKKIYSDKKMEDLKNKNGKTILIFPTHSSEKNLTYYDENVLIKKILNLYSKEYNKIFVCVYWCDVDKECYEVRRNGVQIVSSGFRWDYRFIKRLLTLLSLADDVVVYGFTSAAIYSLALKKNLHVYDAKESYQMCGYGKSVKTIYFHETEEYKKLTKILYGKFGDKIQELTAADEKLLNRYYGLDIHRTPEEIRLIYDISCDIWDNCNHIFRDYPLGVYKTYQMYQEEYEFKKLELLSNATGKRFYYA